MSFFKRIFSKDEPFLPTPTQEVPGLDPLVVQVAEILFPNPEDLRVVFRDLLAAKEAPFHNLVTIQLNLLFFSDGEINQFSHMAIKMEDLDPHRDIWPFKKVKTWALNVIKAGRYVTEPML